MITGLFYAAHLSLYIMIANGKDFQKDSPSHLPFSVKTVLGGMKKETLRPLHPKPREIYIQFYFLTPLQKRLIPVYLHVSSVVKWLPT